MSVVSIGRFGTTPVAHIPTPELRIALRALAIAVSCCAFMLKNDAHAQGSEQLWLDGTVGKTFAGMHRAETEFGYRTVLSDGGWVGYRIVPRLETAPTAHWSFLIGLPLVFTEQQEGSNTFETRAQLGAKYNFTPFKRVQSRLNLRYEYRSVKQEDNDQRQNSDRLRIRAEVVVPLDTDNYRADTMWYAMGDAEVFIGAVADVDERFANRARFRIGAGRKFSYNWRAEILYTLQESRNSLEDTDLTVDNIIRLRFKYYITPRSRKQEHHAH